ncbi:helix-turn-helix domain-containing protein [Halopiger thermotolerans]
MSTSEQLLTTPDDLASPTTKLVYLVLQIEGQATVTDLQRGLGLSKLTLLPVLESLRQRNYVERTEGGYASY